MFDEMLDRTERNSENMPQGQA